MKINVIGTSGSGKSTVSKRISELFSFPYIELDELFWKADWEMSTDTELCSKLSHALQDKPCWVLDGNYSRTIPIKWQDVDAIVWIDYSFIRTFYQALMRALNHSYTKKELWPNTGNRESFKKLLSGDSIVLWTIKTYNSNKQKNQNFINNPNYTHIQFIRVTSPRQIDKMLTKLMDMNQQKNL